MKGMKMSTLLAISLLLAAASAAMITVGQKHVFEGEEFSVSYTANAPLSQHEATISFAGQERKITLPSMAVGSFSADVTFTAPQAGEYDVSSGEAMAKIVVEPAVIALEDVSLSPSSIKPRETAKLKYTVENVGNVEVYNVKSKLSIPNSDKFIYNQDEQELFSTMAPGEKIVQEKEIAARENAGSEARVLLAISYEYDGETHKVEKWITLGTSKLDVGPIAMAAIALLVIAAAKFAASRHKRTS